MLPVEIRLDLICDFGVPSEGSFVGCTGLGGWRRWKGRNWFDSLLAVPMLAGVSERGADRHAGLWSIDWGVYVISHVARGRREVDSAAFGKMICHK